MVRHEKGNGVTFSHSHAIVKWSSQKATTGEQRVPGTYLREMQLPDAPRAALKLMLFFNPISPRTLLR